MVQRWNAGSLIGTGGDDHAARSQRALLREQHIAVLLIAAQCGYLNAASHRRTNRCGVFLDEPPDLTPVRNGVKRGHR